MASFSAYTPQSAGTVPAPSFGRDFGMEFGRGLLQVAKTYQARKGVEEAAGQAASLFGDPTYANIFRSMGLAAVAQGESPTPIINSMMSTAITLKRDQEQMQQRERMANMQFGFQTQLENLRTNNNLRELNARQAIIDDRNSPNALYQQQLNELASGAAAEQTFLESPLGQSTAQRQEQLRQRERADKLEMENSTARQREAGRLEARRDYGVLDLPNEGETAYASLIEDSGVDLQTSPTQMEPGVIQDQIEIISSITDPGAARSLAGRLRLLRDELDIRTGDRSKLRRRNEAIGTEGTDGSRSGLRPAEGARDYSISR